jgi:YVTN family beta-propeller protein
MMRRPYGITSGIRFAFILGTLFIAGCGGGGGVVTPPPPPPAPVPDFSLSVGGPAPSLQVQGAPQGIGIIISGTNGFNSAVTVSLAGLPAGVTAQATGSMSALPESSVGFNLAASSAAAPGTVNITATGTSGSTTHSISVPLTISPGARFQLTVTPSTLAFQPGQQIPLTFSLAVSSGTEPDIQLSASTNINLDSGFVRLGFPSILPSPGNPQMVVATATPAAQPLSPTVITFTAIENGTGQSSSSSVTVSVTSPLGPITAPSRSTFATTNEGVFGAVYDPTRKIVFVASQNLSSILAFSSADGHLVATIPVPLPNTVDETADGSSLFVGTDSDYIYRIDPNLMQVVQQYPGPGPLPSGDHLRPTRILTLSNGKLLALASPLSEINDHIYLFDPSSSTWTNRDQSNPVFGSYGFKRGTDHSTVLLCTSASGAAIFLAYDANSDSFASPLQVEFGGPDQMAVSPDGSHLAILSQTSMNFYDRHLQPLNQFTENGGVTSMIFSRDGLSLFIAETVGSSFISVRRATDYSLQGNVQDLQDTLGSTPVLFDVDETRMVFAGDRGSGGEGIGLVDASNPGLLTLPTPILRSGNTLAPNSGKLNSPAATTVNGANFVAGAQVFFGAAPASAQTQMGTAVTVQSENVIQVTPPVGTAVGPVNVTVVEPGGSLLLEPNAYSYGPQVSFISPGAGPAAGGTTTSFIGFGLGSTNGTTQIMVGNSIATNITVPFVAGYIFGPFNMGSFQASTPSGASGLADVTVNMPEGSTVIPKAFQYLTEAKVFPVSGALGQVIYDGPRQRLYATNFTNNRVEVFSLQTETYLTPIPVGKSPEGLALTPDGTELAVANSGDGTVSVINPSNFSVLATIPALTTIESAPLGGCGAILLSVTPVIPHRMILTFACPNTEDGGGTRLLNLDNQSFDCTGVPTCNPSVGELAAPVTFPFFESTTDGTKALVGDAVNGPSLMGLYDFSLNTLVTAESPASAAILAINDDANTFACNFALFDENLQNTGAPVDFSFLRAAAQSLNNVSNSKLHPSGSLYYVPQNNGVDIFDVRHQRLALRVALVEQSPSTFDGLALDETGARMFAISNSGITVAQLAQIPLSIGTIKPSSGPAAGGTMITIRGSGFETGATVTFGTSKILATFVDANTLQVTTPTLAVGPIQVTVTNPDGQSYKLDAGYNPQ